jgi:hypothetical protein
MSVMTPDDTPVPEDDTIAGAVRRALHQLAGNSTISARSWDDVRFGARRVRRRRIAAFATACAIVLVGAGTATAVVANDGTGRTPHAAQTGAATTATAATPSSSSTSTSGPVTTTSTPPTSPVAPPVGSVTVPSPTAAPTTTGGPAPTLTATPDTGLPERGWVIVTGSGFPPNAGFSVSDCAASQGSASSSYCDPQWWSQDLEHFSSDSAGNLVPQGFPIRRVLGDGTDCATASGRCELQLFSDVMLLAHAPLTFAGPPGPEIPMTLQVDPATNLVDGQTVQVTGDYFMPATENLYECAAIGCEGIGPPVTVGADGTFDTTFTVQRTITVGGQTADCDVESCTISTTQNIATTVPISFAAASPDTTTTTTAGP